MPKSQCEHCKHIGNTPIHFSQLQMNQSLTLQGCWLLCKLTAKLSPFKTSQSETRAAALTNYDRKDNIMENMKIWSLSLVAHISFSHSLLFTFQSHVQHRRILPLLVWAQGFCAWVCVCVCSHTHTACAPTCGWHKQWGRVCMRMFSELRYIDKKKL